MSLIGIISKENDYNLICKNFSKFMRNEKVNFINLKKENLQNFKNIIFDIIIINENIVNLIEASQNLNTIISKAKYIIINSDIENNFNFKISNNCDLITYGLNRKATITISSIKENDIWICIQRSIKAINGTIIESKEFKLCCEETYKNVYNILILGTILSIFMVK